MKIAKSNGEVKKCELRKDLRYGRGRKIPYEEAVKIVQRSPRARLLVSVNMNGFEFCTWEVP
ncbi:MAG: hypothetical protein N2511_07285 [Thermodesulfovibrionales bacterium]|nr:hypothetical protein [Thermodesulfovibrionales bacterium]